jgi:hypothetical protein
MWPGDLGRFQAYGSLLYSPIGLYYYRYPYLAKCLAYKHYLLRPFDEPILGFRFPFCISRRLHIWLPKKDATDHQVKFTLV